MISRFRLCIRHGEVDFQRAIRLRRQLGSLGNISVGEGVAARKSPIIRSWLCARSQAVQTKSSCSNVLTCNPQGLSVVVQGKRFDYSYDPENEKKESQARDWAQDSSWCGAFDHLVWKITHYSQCLPISSGLTINLTDVGFSYQRLQLRVVHGRPPSLR